MLLGGFGHIQDYKQICKANYDFAELDIPEIADLSISEIKDLQKKIKSAIQVPITSRLLPVAKPLFSKKASDLSL